MAVLRISIDTPDPTAADQGALLQIANSPEGLERLGEFLRSIAGGNRTGKVRLNTNTVQASGTVAFSSIVQNDTVTVNGVTHTGKDSPSGDVQFETGVSDESSANSLASKIKNSATNKIVGVVTAYRRATVQLSSFVEDDYVTINGVVFTGKNTPTAGNDNQFAIATADAGTAENLLQAINKYARLHPETFSGKVSFTRSTDTLTLDYDGTLTAAISAHGTVVTNIVVVKAIAGGQAGNLCTLAISAHGTVSGAALTGGTEGTQTVFAQNRYIL